MAGKKRATKKTIRIDAEAAERLARAMLPGETASGAIKRLMPPPFDLKGILKRTAADPISEEFAEAVLARREASRAQQASRRRKAS
jgi:predicted CopG family antitoxin